jgi:hypothetical protein
MKTYRKQRLAKERKTLRKQAAKGAHPFVRGRSHAPINAMT